MAPNHAVITDRSTKETKDISYYTLIDENEKIINFIKNNTPAPLTMIVNKNPNLKFCVIYILPQLKSKFRFNRKRIENHN